MRSHLRGRFYRKTGRGGGGGDGEVGEGLNEREENVGAWRSSAGPCRIHAAPGDHAEPCVSSLRRWKGRGDGEFDDGTRRSVVESGEGEELRGGVLHSVADRASGVMDDGVGERTRQVNCRAVSYQGLDVSAFHNLDDWIAEVFSQNAYRSGAVSGNHAESTVNTFQRLDDCAAEVLRKSAQALESSLSLKSGTLLWDGPEPRYGFPHPRDVCEQALYEHLRGGGTIETATPAMMMRAFKAIVSNRYELVKKVDAPGKKLGGAFSGKSCTHDTEDFVEFHKEETYSPVPSSPSKSEDGEKDSRVRSNVMNFSSGDESKCEVSPRRICRWARLPTKSESVERNPTNPQMSSKSRKDVSLNNVAKRCTMYSIHHDIAKHMEEEEYDFCSIHLKHNEPAPFAKERTECHSLHSKLHELPDQKVEMRLERPEDPCVSDLPQGVVSSLQGARGVPSSRTDSIQHDFTVEVQDKGDTSDESSEIMETSALLTSSVNCDHIVNFKEHLAERTETSTATQTSDVKKQSGRSVHKNERFEGPKSVDWTVEGVGYVTTPRSTTLNGYKACMSSTKNGIQARGAKPLCGKGSLHSESESLPATSNTSTTRRSSKEVLRYPDQSKHRVPPDETLPKTNSSQEEVLPAPRKQRSATTGMKALSEETIQGVQKTCKKNGLVESLQEEPNLSSQDAPTATTAEDAVIAIKKDEETIQIYSTEADLRGTSVKTKCTQTPKFTEMVEISAESVSSLLAKSTQTVGLSTRTSLRVKAQHLDDKSNDVRELPSVEKAQTLNKNPNKQRDESRYDSDLFATRESQSPRTSSSKLDTSSCSSELHTESAGLKLWPTAIPELDNWIMEVVSGWLGAEERLLQKTTNNASEPRLRG